MLINLASRAALKPVLLCSLDATTGSSAVIVHLERQVLISRWLCESGTIVYFVQRDLPTQRKKSVDTKKKTPEDCL